MNSLRAKRYILFAVTFCLLLLSASVSSAQDETEDPAIIAPIVVTSEPFEITFGPGPFNLVTPMDGLADLSSYQAALTISFEGTNAGEPVSWSRTYTLLNTQTPPARQLTIDDSDAGQTFEAQINGTRYARLEDGTCIASAATDSVEPAALLDSVIGADEAGAETVSGIAVNHYTFDERAIGAFDVAESTGEIRVAADGGYLVGYQLSTTGGADYFGEGIDGTLTFDYQLSDVNQPQSITVPEDCPPGLLDVAVMADAVDVVQTPNGTSYTTPSDMDAVLAFYQEQGGEAANPPLIADTIGLFGFTLDDQPMLLIATDEVVQTQVEIVRLASPEQLVLAQEVPGAGGTVASEPSGDCAPAQAELPVLPDASQIQNISGMLTYMTASSVRDAAAFYEEQITAMGGTVSESMPTTNGMAMLEVTIGSQIAAINITGMGGASSVMMMSAANGRLGAAAPATDCEPSAPAETQAETIEPTAIPSGSIEPTAAPAAASSDCSVSSGSNANQRSGPGTTFGIAGTLAAGTSANVDGQATGADGSVWWRLGEGIWVRSDVVVTSGSCENVPVLSN